MVLSDIAIKRPVFATVISLVLVCFGLFAFQRLSVREYPDIDPPIVSVTTNYKGASANVVEVQITQILEEAVERSEPLSILGLRGLGKEAWREVEASAHVAAERRAWD